MQAKWVTAGLCAVLSAACGLRGESSYITFDRARALTEIAGQYQAVGQAKQATSVLAEAQQTAASIRNPCIQPRALSEVAGQYAAVGQSRQALKISAQAIQVSQKASQKCDSDAVLLSHLGAHYLEIQQPALTLQVAQQMESTEKVSTWLQVASQYAEAGQTQAVVDLLTQILAQVKAPQLDLSSAQLAELAGLQAAIGKRQSALEQLMQASQAAKAESGIEQVFGLIAIGHQYAELGQTKQALALLNQAQQTSQTLNNAALQTSLLADLAVEYRRLNQSSLAAAALTQAAATAQTLSPLLQAQTWIDLAAEDSAVRSQPAAQPQQITQLLDQALQDAQVSKDHSLITEVAIRYAQIGQPARALQVTKAMEGEFHSERSRALVSIANAYAQQGQFGQALQIGQSAADPYYRVRALIQIASQYKTVGQQDQATTILNQALQMARSLGK